MAHQYIELHANYSEYEQELFLAKIYELPFDSVWQKEDEIVVYFVEELLTDEILLQISNLVKDDAKQLEVVASENKNWNKIWEQSFQPVNIDTFCYIRADFHPQETDCLHTITINPKMAFGTAHHPTTYMMMEMMADIDCKNKLVFDYGCGTSILSILAEKLSAASVLAIDNDENAVSNSLEHIQLNDCKKITVEQGNEERLKSIQNMDVILANINRHVLLKSARQLFSCLSDDGILLISGILEEDHALITKTYLTAGFNLLVHKQKGDWMCYQFSK